MGPPESRTGNAIFSGTGPNTPIIPTALLKEFFKNRFLRAVNILYVFFFFEWRLGKRKSTPFQISKRRKGFESTCLTLGDGRGWGGGEDLAVQSSEFLF